MLTYKNVSQMLLFLSIGALPPLSGFFLGASSMALGVFLSLILIIFIKFERLKHALYVHKSIFFWLILFLVYGLVQHVFVGFWDVKSYLSCAALLIVFLAAYFLSKEILFNNASSENAILFLFWCLIFFVVLAIVTQFFIGYLIFGHNKTIIFPFGEPSHFALYFGPFFLMVVALSVSKFVKIFYICLVAVFALIIPSTTLLIYVLLALGLMVRFSKSSLFVFAPMLVVAIYVMLTNSYFISRLILTNDSTNLTALVYLQGLQDAYNSLISTHGIGLGFQMLGTQPISLAGMQINYLMGGEDLNRTDGGFLAAKLVAELGVYGILLLVSYLAIFFKALKKLRHGAYRRSNNNLASVFSLCCIYASFVEFFVRGVGYFSPSLFLFFAALFLYSIISKADRKEARREFSSLFKQVA